MTQNFSLPCSKLTVPGASPAWAGRAEPHWQTASGKKRCLTQALMKMKGWVVPKTWLLGVAQLRFVQLSVCVAWFTPEVLLVCLTHRLTAYLPRSLPWWQAISSFCSCLQNVLYLSNYGIKPSISNQRVATEILQEHLWEFFFYPSGCSLCDFFFVSCLLPFDLELLRAKQWPS